MKKVVVALLMAAIVTGGAFAIDLSAGIGGAFSGIFQTYNWTDDGKDFLDAFDIEKDAFNQNNIGGGFFAYFDASYVMLSFGMSFFDNSPANKDAKKWMDDNKIKNSATFIDIGLYGKFPIDLDGLTLFPMLGGEVKLPIAMATTVDGEKFKYTNDDGDEVSPMPDHTTLWLKVGVGADIPLSEQMYLRFMGLYGIGTLGKLTQEAMDEDNKDTKFYSILNHGFDLKVAIGFKF